MSKINLVDDDVNEDNITTNNNDLSTATEIIESILTSLFAYIQNNCVIKSKTTTTTDDMANNHSSLSHIQETYQISSIFILWVH